MKTQDVIARAVELGADFQQFSVAVEVQGIRQRVTKAEVAAGLRADAERLEFRTRRLCKEYRRMARCISNSVICLKPNEKVEAPK